MKLELLKVEIIKEKDKSRIMINQMRCVTIIGQMLIYQILLAHLREKHDITLQIFFPFFLFFNPQRGRTAPKNLLNNAKGGA